MSQNTEISPEEPYKSPMLHDIIIKNHNYFAVYI